MHSLSRLQQLPEKLWSILGEVALGSTAKQLKDLFDLVNIDDFFSRASYRPVLQQSQRKGYSEACLFFHIYFDAVLQLGVERAEVLDLVEGDQHSVEKYCVLLF